MISNTFLLDGWLVDVSSGLLSRGSTVARLEPQVMKVLVHLAEQPGTVVPREEFLDKLWGKSFVGDSALTRCIYEIRQAFGDNPRKPKIIETVPKVGFRLLVQPLTQSERKSNKYPALLWATAASLVLIALVLPGQRSNLESREIAIAQSPAVQTYYKALAYLEVPTRMSNQNAIAMFDRAIRLDPRLGLAHAGLANAISQEQLYWGGDQVDVAFTAATTALRLAPDAPQSHIASGLVQRARGDFSAALASFATAIRLEPDNVDAIYNSADIYRQRLEFGRATDHYLTVLRIAPDHASAMKRLGFLYIRTGDLFNARKWIERVIDDTPMDGYANIQLATLELVAGNTEAALAICEQVLGLYPAQKACLHILGDGNLRLGNYDEALSWFNYEIESHEESSYAQLGVAQVFLATDQGRKGLAIVDDLLDEYYARASVGDPDWNEYWVIAACLTLKGDADSALQWLDNAAAAGRRFPLWDAGDSAFKALHGDQRFNRYVAKTMPDDNGPV
ncbi:MAG: tetratricopeptide repeat protein [Gammaproteobacteria bacterium]|nr:tetratricopeptide repeat protein [Gammaproteobacteria bacterium]